MNAHGYRQQLEMANRILAQPKVPEFHCPLGAANCGVKPGGAVCYSGDCSGGSCGVTDPRSIGNGLVPVAHPVPSGMKGPNGEGMAWCQGRGVFVPAGTNMSRECNGTMPF